MRILTQKRGLFNRKDRRDRRNAALGSVLKQAGAPRVTPLFQAIPAYFRVFQAIQLISA
jgi:hypothetical protein